jgi:hypothetical protein
MERELGARLRSVRGRLSLSALPAATGKWMRTGKNKAFGGSFFFYLVRNLLGHVGNWRAGYSRIIGGVRALRCRSAVLRAILV